MLVQLEGTLKHSLIVKLLFRYQVIKSYSVFCFHHGPGPPARQLSPLTNDSVRWFGPPIVLLGVMDWNNTCFELF